MNILPDYLRLERFLVENFILHSPLNTLPEDDDLDILWLNEEIFIDQEEEYPLENIEIEVSYFVW